MAASLYSKETRSVWEDFPNAGRIVIVRVTACPRCREEVADGAPWCPHCGRDMTVYPPLETARHFTPEPIGHIRSLLKPAAIGIVLGLAAAIFELVVLRASPVAAILIAVVVLFIGLIALTEFICPSGALVRGPGHSALRGVRVGVAFERNTWAPSPALVIMILPAVAVLAAIVILEHFPST